MKECANCGAAMQEGQDWCVQCGAARKGRLPGAPGWLTGAAVLMATALLVAGASVAAYAALSKHARKAHRPLALQPSALAQGTVPPPGTTTPATPGSGAPGSSTPGSTPGSSGTTPALPTGAAPPKIPTQTPTPEGSGGGGAAGSNPFFPPESGQGGKGGSGGASGKGGTAASKGKSGKSGKSGGKGSGEGVSEGQGGEAPSEEQGSKGSGSEGGSEQPTPILLDTNAASTYNPNAYPSSAFGDPSLAIDGEGSTAWTAAVQAANAPHMAEGLVLDLRTAQKLGSIEVKSPTPGFTVEVYGANGHDLPAAITDSAWKKLHGARLLKKKNVTFKLKTKGAAYRFALLWLVKAPPSSTPADPGAVKVAELELFPPS